MSSYSQTTQSQVYMPGKEAAKIVRSVLKTHFAATKFSVTFPGHDAICVTWTDGPTYTEVDQIIRANQNGFEFIGVLLTRHYSEAAYSKVAQTITELTGQSCYFPGADENFQGPVNDWCTEFLVTVSAGDGRLLFDNRAVLSPGKDIVSQHLKCTSL